MFLKEAQLLKRCDANKSLCLVITEKCSNVKFGKNRKHCSQQSWKYFLNKLNLPISIISIELLHYKVNKGSIHNLKDKSNQVITISGQWVVNFAKSG